MLRSTAIIAFDIVTFIIMSQNELWRLRSSSFQQVRGLLIPISYYLRSNPVPVPDAERVPDVEIHHHSDLPCRHINNSPKLNCADFEAPHFNRFEDCLSRSRITLGLIPFPFPTPSEFPMLRSTTIVTCHVVTLIINSLKLNCADFEAPHFNRFEDCLSRSRNILGIIPFPKPKPSSRH
jgi:hypothetical protein